MNRWCAIQAPAGDLRYGSCLWLLSMEDTVALSPTTTPNIAPEAGSVFLIEAHPECPGELPWPALAALAAAETVVHDDDVDPETLALVPQRCFVEPAPGDVARVRKLAGEGWRVVWLVVGDPVLSPDKRAAAERLADAGITVRMIASLSGPGLGVSRRTNGCGSAPAPQSFGTALNGLAG
jgi:hypothetical protein